MLERTKSSYTILCEGNSENAYIQNLNRFLDENGYNFTFNPKKIGCGHFTAVQQKYRVEKKKNPKSDIKIWVDRDTYIRNDCGDGDKYQEKPQYLPNFIFSVMNFEDFLAMHLDDKTLDNWFQVCSREKHNIAPMTEDKYLPLVRQYLFSNDIPFEITTAQLNNLFSNNAKYFFNCDFASLLFELINKHE